MNTLQIQDSFEPYYADRKEDPDKRMTAVEEHKAKRRALKRLKDELRKSDNET